MKYALRTVGALLAMGCSAGAWGQVAVPPQPADAAARKYVAEKQRLDDVRWEYAKQRLEKGTYLGVLTSPVSAPLREQLKLAKGIGLMVDHVEEGSPAAAAGLKQYDILQKLNDQLLVNNQQLMVLVRMYKANEQVKLSVIRQGQPMTLEATLAEKEVAPIDERNPWGVPPMNMNVDGLGGQGGVAGPAGVHALAANVEGGGAQVVMRDDALEVRLRTNPKGSKSLKAIDVPSGRVIFDGPVNTPEERKSLPPNVADRVKVLEDRAAVERMALDQAVQTLKATPKGERTMRYSDGRYDLKATRRGESLTLRVRDTRGRELFNGPVDTPEQRQELPEGVEALLEQLLQQEHPTPKPAVALPPGN